MTSTPAQASDEPMRAAERELVRACKAATTDAEKVAAIDAYRAAIKAQPAPTEAQGVAVSVERGGVYIVKGVQSFRLAYEGETRAEQEWYAEQLRKVLQPSGNTGELVQGEDSARLDALADELVNAYDNRLF